MYVYHLACFFATRKINVNQNSKQYNKAMSRDPPYSRMSSLGRKLVAGGLSGMVARSFVAPLDRVKIMIQTAKVTGENATGIRQVSGRIMDEGGLRSFWKGNGTNCIRVFPHTAVQFGTFSYVKDLDLLGHPIYNRLLSGAMSGAVAATFTQPLDVIRVRLQTDAMVKSFGDATRAVYAEKGFRSLYKGYSPTLLSLSPFIAINFACFDSLRAGYNPHGSSSLNMLFGAASGALAQSVCFPLDTVRRRMQVKGVAYPSVWLAFSTITKHEGITGFYRGIVPNLLKVMPNNAIRFSAFNYLDNMYKA